MEEFGSDQKPVFNHPINHESSSLPNGPAAKPRRNRKKYALVGVIGLLIIMGTGFFVLSRKKPAAPAPAATTQPESTSETSTSTDIPNAELSEAYENGFLGIKLSYPKGWEVIEPESKDSVRLESPQLTYQNADGTNVSGHFRIYVRKGARTIDGTYIGRGTALRPSEKLTYAKPAPGQRTETNLSLFGLDTPDNFAFFLIAGNYSLKKGDTLGPNYGKEAETYIIAGGFSSPELKDDLATHQVAPELLETSNAYKQAIEILKTLQLR